MRPAVSPRGPASCPGGPGQSWKSHPLEGLCFLSHTGPPHPRTLVMTLCPQIIWGYPHSVPSSPQRQRPHCLVKSHSLRVQGLGPPRWGPILLPSRGGDPEPQGAGQGAPGAPGGDGRPQKKVGMGGTLGGPPPGLRRLPCHGLCFLHVLHSVCNPRREPSPVAPAVRLVTLPPLPVSLFAPHTSPCAVTLPTCTRPRERGLCVSTVPVIQPRGPPFASSHLPHTRPICHQQVSCNPPGLPFGARLGSRSLHGGFAPQ